MLFTNIRHILILLSCSILFEMIILAYPLFNQCQSSIFLTIIFQQHKYKSFVRINFLLYQLYCNSFENLEAFKCSQFSYTIISVLFKYSLILFCSVENSSAEFCDNFYSRLKIFSQNLKTLCSVYFCFNLNLDVSLQLYSLF